MLRRFFFNLRYLHCPPWDTGIVPPEIEALLTELPPGRALDLGCGTGTSSLALAKAGWQVTGVDFAARAIRKARQKAARASLKVDFHTGDVTRLDGIRGPFELALDIGCFHSLTPVGKQDYLSRLEALLTPGGHWFLYAFLSPGQPAPSNPAVCPADLERILAQFTLLSHQDGLDRNRPSAYFLLRKSNL
jgi:cyclopropane fatty-acyl-phospholipid synthase-like methyltransferase